jgi:hypothetical protein
MTNLCRLHIHSIGENRQTIHNHGWPKENIKQESSNLKDQTDGKLIKRSCGNTHLVGTGLKEFRKGPNNKTVQDAIFKFNVVM